MKIQQQKFEVTRDGLTIRGTCFRPEGGDGLPIAIVSHGFLATQATTRGYARWFAEQGYAACCFDFIGGGVGSKSDGSLRDMSVLTEKADLLAVLDHMCALPGVNPADVTLAGCSQGGLVSALVAADVPQRVSRLILFYPALCIPDDARRGQMMFFRFDPENIPDKLTAGPLTLGGDYARAVIGMDTFAAITPYTGPVLILHGEKDGIVPVDYARRARAAYGDRAELHILPGADHGFKPKEDVEALGRIRAFLP